MKPFEDLFAIADSLERASKPEVLEVYRKELDRAVSVTEEIGKSASGSWWGYHSRVYYKDFLPPPAGARFSVDSGLSDSYISKTIGDWVEYNEQDVAKEINRRKGNPDLSEITNAAVKAIDTFKALKSDILSLISTEISGEDGYLNNLRDELERLKVYTHNEVAKSFAPSGRAIISDLDLLTEGIKVPFHFNNLAKLKCIYYSFQLCARASEIARKAGSHLERKERSASRSARVGTNIFIGHGRSTVWRDLKDFIKDRLGLPYDEFNRVPVAGYTNIARLSEMMDAAAIAFIVMTAEDEQLDGSMHARMNVLHEAGLFQGRLGFSKSIILLEEGCEEFSNIQGLGQLRFPKGNIDAIFEKIREVLERENIINTNK